MQKNIVEYTYYNAAKVAETLEAMGYRPIQTVNCYNLQEAGAPGDRETFHIEGNAFFVAQRPFAQEWGRWNLDYEFDVSFNSEGMDEDDWVRFKTSIDLPVQTDQTINFYKIENFMFYKFTIRNAEDHAITPARPIKIHVTQDPSFVIQINKLIKDIIT